MPGKTSIEWTDDSWNPVTGCTQVSPGCDHCYAMVLHNHRHEIYSKNDGCWTLGGKPMPPQYAKPFSEIQLFSNRLDAPLHWRKPRKIFVNSMSDLFHKDIPLEFIIQVFRTMNAAHWHTFQVLTKRPSRVALHAHELPWSSNILLGTSIEDNAQVWRADKLRQVHQNLLMVHQKSEAPILPRLFISAEPLLGELTHLHLESIAWLIAGAESGDGARRMDEDWVRFLRDRCVDDGVAFFYKQNATSGGHKIPTPKLDGRIWTQFPVMETFEFETQKVVQQ